MSDQKLFKTIGEAFEDGRILDVEDVEILYDMVANHHDILKQYLAKFPFIIKDVEHPELLKCKLLLKKLKHLGAFDGVDDSERGSQGENVDTGKVSEKKE